MKKMTLWHRLNASMVLLILLLLAGAALAWWVQKARSDTNLRNAQLDDDAAKIRGELELLSLLLDPQTDGNKALVVNTSEELKDTLRYFHFPLGYREREKLAESLRNIRDFFKILQNYKGRGIELEPADRQRRDEILAVFAREVEVAKSVDAENAQQLSVWGAVGMVALLVISVWAIRAHAESVSRPLNQLVGTLERMRQGDFTKRIEIERQDEFGIVAAGLNRLADDLSVLVGQVQRSGIQVNSTATEIAATAKQQQGTANQIAATTAEIGATSKQISTTSTELVKTMNEVTHVAEEAARVAGHGQAAIGSMEATMRSIIEAGGSITARLAILNEKTSNINSVVTTITKVADQTNLLSLNAAIEAEKAGEYGLGFGVVAIEIRRLADQTAVATYDIEKMVKEMQTAVAAGVMGMDKFSEEVRRGVTEIRQVGAQLARVIHEVQTLTPRFHTVNEGMQSQATGARQISETLTLLSEAAYQTAESLRQSNAAIDQLDGAAQGLQSSITRFKFEES